MKIFVCIDDTDNLESRGTGELASLLAHEVNKNGWGKSSYITRHQLLIHPDVPYTSHNSSMCFSADVGEAHIETLISHAAVFLEKESAEGADPGLCIAVAERLERLEELMAFGLKAKQVVITKREAYELAEQPGIHLSAHGGTGDGVIGALAGVGLRLSGNDGRVRGGLMLGPVNSVSRVCEIYAHPYVEEVRSLDGHSLQDEEMVELGEKIKTVLLDGKAVLLVMPYQCETNNAQWKTCPKEMLKKY